MILFQSSEIPAATRRLYVVIVVFVLLAIIPCSLQAETVAEEAGKIAAAAKAGELFARMAEEQVGGKSSGQKQTDQIKQEIPEISRWLEPPSFSPDATQSISVLSGLRRRQEICLW